MEKAARRGVMNSAHTVFLPQTPFHSSPTAFSITLLLLRSLPNFSAELWGQNAELFSEKFGNFCPVFLRQGETPLVRRG